MQSEPSLKKQSKKKIIIVNNNMKIGGVQKALLDLLCEISSQYEVTLYLLNRVGDYLDRVPSGVTVIGGDSPYRYFGMSQAESKHSKRDYACRTALATVARLLGRRLATRIINACTKKLPEDYDCAISYMHDAGPRLLYGGCNDFVLSKIKAKSKITFVHCDYENSGSNCGMNNATYPKFDYVVACSEGCRRSFLRALPHLEAKTKTVINCHNFEEITALSNEMPMKYEKQFVNAVIVARLSPEKGIERALYALQYALERGVKLRLHIVGGGNQMEALKRLCNELVVSDHVTLYGEQTNPYRFVKNADFLLIPSFHEAAPLVIDEAVCLGVPILSTKTTSSEDMILQRGCGWVCENEQEALNRKLYEIASQQNKITEMRKMIADNISCDNSMALRTLRQVIG